jgi:hypothetical protein
MLEYINSKVYYHIKFLIGVRSACITEIQGFMCKGYWSYCYILYYCKGVTERFKRTGEIGEMTAGGANNRDEKRRKETMVRKE